MNSRACLLAVSCFQSSNPTYPPPTFDDDGVVPAPPPAAYGGRNRAGGGGAGRGLSRPNSNVNLSSEQMYIQQNVEHALAALEENLKTDEGKRMLAEDMVSKNLPVRRCDCHFQIISLCTTWAWCLSSHWLIAC